jgi:hypothetical protein
LGHRQSLSPLHAFLHLKVTWFDFIWKGWCRGT